MKTRAFFFSARHRCFTGNTLIGFTVDTRTYVPQLPCELTLWLHSSCSLFLCRNEN